MNKNYDDYVTKYSNNFIKVIVNKDTVTKINNFVPKLVVAKKNEVHHQNDNRNEIKRHTTGLLGEAAVEQLLGISIIDWSIGESKNTTMTISQDIELVLKLWSIINFQLFSK